VPPEDWLSARIRDSRSPDGVMVRNPPPDLILFGGGLPDPVTHPTAEMRAMISEIIAANEPAVFGYGVAAGDPRLRELIATRLGGERAGLGSDNVVVTNGSSGAIGLTALGLLEPGDVVVVESLTYNGATKAFMQMGASVVPAPMDEDGLDPDGLAAVLEQVRAAGQQVKLIYTIASCHNPSGAVLSLERRMRLLALAEAHQALVVQDDTYGEIRFQDDFPPPMIALAPERVVHLGSFSKTIAPTLRVGWVAAGRDIAAAFARARTDLGISSVNQRFVARFIDEGFYEPHVRRATTLYRRKRDRLSAALELHCRGLASWRTPEGGFFLWLALARSDAAQLSAACREEKVAMLPGPYFTPDGAGFPNHIRLSYGQLAEGLLEEGAARLGRAMARAADTAS